MGLRLGTDITYSRGTTEPCTVSSTLPQECFSIAQMCEGQRVSGCNKDTDSVTVTHMTFHMSTSCTLHGHTGWAVHVYVCVCVCVCFSTTDSLI